MYIEKDLGWVKVYRKLLNDSLWEACNSNRKVIMITMLLLANHKDKEIILKSGKKLKIKSGQFLTSIDNLSKKCGKGITRDVVYKALYFFEKVDFCLQERPQGGQQEGTLITIVNWTLYQSEEKNDNKIDNKEDVKKTISRQQNKNVKNEKKNNLFVETSNEFRLSKYLFDLIRKNNPKAKEPNFQTWSKQFDLMIRVDKREVQEIKNLIKWSQNDSFWYKNILSPQKLRKQYDQLIVKMYDDKTVKPNITQVQSTDIYKLDENGDFSF
ncbi:hypothetical protein KQI18_12110 [Clostridioides mangenotii]|uniref:hypothetical protein n=1 Tax=Metaclostridioides mangenotii TaxID=1540 RepID=UPI001C0FF56E|nr:hypothetical protein [Clostridioides mangenotii]MBU5308521.1 hypothetical protein [Clostridioides mangenotii]